MGGSSKENAAIIRALFEGKIQSGLKDTIILNAGVAVYLYGLANTLEEGVAIARNNLENGKALQLLQKWSLFAKKNFLDEILFHKKNEIANLKRKAALDEKHELLDVLEGKRPRLSRSFKKAILAERGCVIAEIKRKSPSKGNFSTIPDPLVLAKEYAKGGAKAISVLTDTFGFSGRNEDLQRIAENLSDSCVVLRKDFLIDPIQLAESVVIGADAALLIVAVLQQETKDMVAFAKEMGIEVVVEVFNEKELQIAIDAGAEIIAINSRNLRTFEVDTEIPRKLLPLIPKGIVTVAASGLKDPEEAAALFAMGFNAVLVGDTLVKEKDPAAWINAARSSYAR